MKNPNQVEELLKFKINLKNQKQDDINIHRYNHDKPEIYEHIVRHVVLLERDINILNWVLDSK